MTLFRERLLARLVESDAISQELVAKLVGCKHPGFSVHAGEPIAPEEKLRLEDTAAYLVRDLLSLKKLVYLDGEKAVVYRSRMNPFLGRNFEPMDPLEWLARLSDHIPELGRCGRRMSVVGFVSDSAAIGRILHHLGLSSPEAEKPPPVREVLRVAEHEDGWGVPAEWA
jgi:hypothetical protein